MSYTCQIWLLLPSSAHPWFSSLTEPHNFIYLLLALTTESSPLFPTCLISSESHISNFPLYFPTWLIPDHLGSTRPKLSSVSTSHLALSFPLALSITLYSVKTETLEHHQCILPLPHFNKTTEEPVRRVTRSLAEQNPYD